MDYLYELALIKDGKSFVVGIDEAGRGPLAGPIVAAAVCFDESIQNNIDLLSQVNDSKILSEKKRLSLHSIIKEEALFWSIGLVHHSEVDKIGIGEANRVCARRALSFIPKVDFVAVDYIARLQFDKPYAIIKKGDQKVFSIAAASILAKVYRDKLMKIYDDIYPEYGFAQHKGYGTKLHKENLALHGASPIHRKSFTW